jgi:hypothetical protein
MAFWSREKAVTTPTKSMDQVFAEFEFVDATDDAVIVTEPSSVLATRQLADPDIREIGSSSPSPFWGRFEYNNSLRGHTGLLKYDEMRRSDSSVAGALQLGKTPVLGARWFIKPYSEPGEEPTARDRNAAQHVWWNLTEGMTTSWPQFLHECLCMLDFGYYLFEKVFTVTHPLKPGKACWKKLSPRHPLDVVDWEYDANGGPAGVWVPAGSGLGNEFIAIDKLLCFTHAKEGGDMTGMSVLRSAYKHWYMKSNLEKIDAIQKERHGIGVPIIKLPPGFNNADKALAEQMGRNLRTNERAHIVLPPGWEIMFAKLEGQPVDTLKSIEYHDRMIWSRVLARFMANTNSTIKDDDRILFLQATRVIAEVVQDVMNKYAIPQLVDFNWLRLKGYPKLKARRIGEQADWRTLSFAMRNMIGAGVIRPDDKLEDQVREEMDLPEVDVETLRQTKTPQGPPGQPEAPEGAPQPPSPPRVGPPRQPPPSAQPPRGNAGRDASGGR